MSDTAVKHTPLHAEHVRLGARMVPFAGFDMPVYYGGIIEEHMAVRESAGIFDVSHMGEVMATGPHAEEFVQRLVSNDVTRLTDGRAMYTVMCRPDGGIVDDLLVYRMGPSEYMLVVNAANIEGDVAWMRAHNPMGADLEDISDGTALVAVQGPRAFEIVGRIAGRPLDDLPFYHFTVPSPGSFLGCRRAVLSHTGYTGEPGLEIYCEKEKALDVWKAVMDAGADLGLAPAGLGARDTLRLESGYCLYGNDITTATNPLEAGLGWLTKLDKGDFVGRDALIRAKEAGIGRRLVAFVLSERGIPRAGMEIVDPSGAMIGSVTSGTQSPILGQGIGMGYVPNDPAHTAPGSPIRIQARGRVLEGTVRKPPLHKSS
jgi:aminomethyltransferase